ncbi:kti12, chromatin associated [Coemansia javaensis]|uniref:Kti12, chromatin associated n=1 Tax=Coemansia javaensis TaxID=2761396 RepID=A0A9W8HB79_9FUNG|nr:kti12, chromatin associated [Coemansia javaensis]
MPLVIITGLPSSGKTTRALELKRLLEARIEARIEAEAEAEAAAGQPLSVQIVGDDSLGVGHAAYAAAQAEKDARGALLSAVSRAVSRQTIVIADAPNYIKGLRYQLYCAAREVGTTHCVVHCAIPTAEARRINAQRGAAGYDAAVFEALAARYEEPSAAARWDRPLFTLIQHDPDDRLPLAAIWAALVERRAPPPHFATAAKPAAGSADYVFELDRATQAVVAAILDAQRSGVPVALLPVPGTAARVRMPARALTPSELRRQRMQFTSLNRQAPLPADRIAELFVEYLNISL